MKHHPFAATAEAKTKASPCDWLGWLCSLFLPFPHPSQHPCQKVGQSHDSLPVFLSSKQKPRSGIPGRLPPFSSSLCTPMARSLCPRGSFNTGSNIRNTPLPSPTSAPQALVLCSLCHSLSRKTIDLLPLEKGAVAISMSWLHQTKTFKTR